MSENEINPYQSPDKNDQQTLTGSVVNSLKADSRLWQVLRIWLLLLGSVLFSVIFFCGSTVITICVMKTQQGSLIGKDIKNLINVIAYLLPGLGVAIFALIQSLYQPYRKSRAKICIALTIFGLVGIDAYMKLCSLILDSVRL